VRGIFLFLI